MLILCETGLTVGAVALSLQIRLGDEARMLITAPETLWRALLIAVVCQLCLYYTDLYDRPIPADRRELFVRILQAMGATSLILAAVYFWFPSLIVGRGVFVIAGLLVVAMLLGWRIAFELLTRHVVSRERLLLVGTNPAAVSLARELYHRRELGVEIVGFIDPDPAKLGTPVINPGVIGTIDDIPAIVRARGVDRVVVSLANARGQLPMNKLLEMKMEGVRFDHLAALYEEYTGKIAVENLRPSWLIFSEGFRKSQLLRSAKRAIDVIGAGIGALIAVPLMGLIAIAVKATSRGPVFYHQQRVGRHGRVFTVHKFRSMRDNAEAATGVVWASRNDSRVTMVGRFLRRSRFDELPQLWNILKGEMSLVGPRPERPEFVKELSHSIPFYNERHAVRPGLTGWAQVRYTYGASAEDAMEKLQYDLFYIKNMSIARDLFIIFETIKTVVLYRGA
ncbi:MAG TPA: TIGR03013 family XrtA/PEP-CTERM system glycosyltransferase [Vicinamibacterales bacterium]